MESQRINKYEQQRLANIKRNADKIAALNIHSTVSQLTALSKRQRTQNSSLLEKKSMISDSQLVIRRSLRCRGITPEEKSTKAPENRESPINLTGESGSIKMSDAFVCKSGLDDRKFVKALLGVSQNSQVSQSTCTSHELAKKGDQSNAVLDSLKVGPEKRAQVLPRRVYTMCFLPSNDKRMVVVGGDFGNVGFWNVDSVDDGDRIYVYQPHSAAVSGILFQQFSMSKIFSCSHDGYIRLMDVERETFDLAYAGAQSITTISQRPSEVKSLYFSEGQGKLDVWDESAAKSSAVWSLHKGRINSIDFNAHNTNLMTTSSNDGTACVWDLRKVAAHKPEAVIAVNHKRAVNSAYFSPSGSLLSTTSVGDAVGLLSGANYGSVSMLYHNNTIAYPLRCFWGWDDSYVFIGTRKGVDVISTTTKQCVDTFLSPVMSAPPRLFEKHPGKVGLLAGASNYGPVYLWTSC